MTTVSNSMKRTNLLHIQTNQMLIIEMGNGN